MQFGRYTLTKRVASGGMAEIWKAKATGAAGFEKTVAIKKVLPNLASDPEFTAMFIAEAKLVSGLQHANVVQVFDFGQVGEDQYYLAMEYVSGGSLAVLCRRLAEKQKRLPLDVALYVVVEAARGLGYAHSRTDRTGQPLNIIHRDVSPHNLLVSFDGDVKVADFGIARAASRISVTATGIVRGKAAYMSPEQAMGKGLDPRSDLFCLGLVFYELVTGKRLFDGESTNEIMGRVAFWQPGEMPEAPPPVAPLLKKVLAALPEDRFADASELEEACAAILGSDGAVRARKALAAAMREELAPEYSAEMSADSETEQAAASVSSKDSTRIMPGRPPRPKPPGRKRGPLLGALAVVAVLAALAVSGVLPQKTPVAPPSPGELWFATVRGSCNLLEVESRLRDFPPPPGAEGAGYAAACYVLAGKSETSREVIAALPAEERPAAAETVFGVASVAAGADDEAAVRVTGLVLEFAPDQPLALLQAGLAEYRMGSDSAATAHLTRFLALHADDDERAQEARAVLSRVEAYVALRQQARARAEVTPRPFVAGTSMAAIPAGCFEMGDPEGEADEQPRHRVCLGAFLLDRLEVTNARYRELLEADPARPAPENCCNSKYDYWHDRDIDQAWVEKPVVNVSWKDASAFCAWDGKRLPTEAEWEYAARGGLAAGRFPWGDDPPSDELGSLRGARYAVEWDGGNAIRAVGSYPANGYGLHDMAGNVWEWTADRYRPEGYAAPAPGVAPSEGDCCVVRGGSWASNEAAHLRVSNRLLINDSRPSEVLRSIGIRCAADAHSE